MESKTFSFQGTLGDPSKRMEKEIDSNYYSQQQASKQIVLTENYGSLTGIIKKEDLKQSIETGNIVECKKDEYSTVRMDLHTLVGEFIDTNQVIKAQIALSEIKRLDKKFIS